MMPVRWGILGVAGINAAMVPALQASDSAELVGIASRDLARAQTAAEGYGIEAFDGYDALLADPRIEAIYLPVPNAQHAEWAIRAAESGRHVLCEKPMAVTEPEARAMAAAASEHGVLLAEAFMYAQHPRFATIRTLIADGVIGPVRSIHTVFTFDASDELDHSGFRGAPGSGAIYDVGCYAVHASRLLLDAEPEAITAHAQASEMHGGIDMSTALLMEFPGGVAATAQVGMWNADQDTIEITGSRGRITVPHAFLCGVDEGDFLLTVGETTEVVVVPAIDHYVAQVERFSAAVRGEIALAFAPEDAIRGARILEAASVAWRERRRIPLV